MEFQNTTAYTKERVLSFQRFNARLLKGVWWSTYFIFALLFALLLVGLVFSLVKGMWLYLAIIVAGIVIFARRIYFLYIAPARKFDKSSFNGLTQSFIFRKQGFSVASGEDEKKYRYEELFAVYVTPLDYYLYFNKGQAFIVAKDGFSEGSPAQFEARIAERVGKKRYLTIDK